MNNRIYTFQVFNIDHKIQAFKTFPIYDDSGALIGSFCRENQDHLRGFIAGTGHPVALSAGAGQPFFMHIETELKDTIYATVSDVKMSKTYQKILTAQEIE